MTKLLPKPKILRMEMDFWKKSFHIWLSSNNTFFINFNQEEHHKQGKLFFVAWFLKVFMS